MEAASLFLLQRMRLFAWFRRIGRKMASPKGLLLTLFGSLFFVFQFSIYFLNPGGARSPQAVEMTRRIGPVFLLAYCLLTLLFSPGDKAFAFTPAEISFLFTAPYTRRQLLLYKIGGNVGLVCISSLFFTIIMRSNSPNWLSGYFGLALTFVFLQLFAITVTLAGSAIGAAASSLRRKLALGLIVAMIGGVLFSTGLKTVRDFDIEKIKDLEFAPFVQVVLAPFRPFSRAITSQTAFELIKWGSASLAINLGLIAIILALDAQYLESVATSSERLYARIERMRKGGPMLPSERKSGKPRKGLPDFPWWGGIGPIFWRQLSTATRDYLRVVVSVLVFAAFAGLGIFLTNLNPNGPIQEANAVAPTLAGIILAFSLLFSPLYAFDFRGDYDRMEGLKSLPISAERLAIGQIAAPLVLVTGPQVLGMLVLAIGTWPVNPFFWAFPAFALPLNALLLEVENLMFLWFPSRPMAHTPGDIQAMGRAMLLMLAKILTVLFAAGIAALCGLLVYFPAGWPGAMITSWCVTMGFVVLLLPFIAEAFRKFDVASDTPE